MYKAKKNYYICEREALAVVHEHKTIENSRLPAGFHLVCRHLGPTRENIRVIRMVIRMDLYRWPGVYAEYVFEIRHR